MLFQAEKGWLILFSQAMFRCCMDANVIAGNGYRMPKADAHRVGTLSTEADAGFLSRLETRPKRDDFGERPNDFL